MYLGKAITKWRKKFKNRWIYKKECSITGKTVSKWGDLNPRKLRKTSGNPEKTRDLKKLAVARIERILCKRTWKQRNFAD